MIKLAKFLYKLANFIKLLAEKIKEISYHRLDEPEMYYVYVPHKDKPTHVHFSFKDADEEARRIKRKCFNQEDIDYDVEVLKIVKSYPSEIPF